MGALHSLFHLCSSRPTPTNTLLEKSKSHSQSQSHQTPKPFLAPWQTRNSPRLTTESISHPYPLSAKPRKSKSVSVIQGNSNSSFKSVPTSQFHRETEFRYRRSSIRPSSFASLRNASTTTTTNMNSGMRGLSNDFDRAGKERRHSSLDTERCGSGSNLIPEDKVVESQCHTKTNPSSIRPHAGNKARRPNTAPNSKYHSLNPSVLSTHSPNVPSPLRNPLPPPKAIPIDSSSMRSGKKLKKSHVVQDGWEILRAEP